MQLYPGWSARDNYGYGTKKKKRKKERTTVESGGTCSRTLTIHQRTCTPIYIIGLHVLCFLTRCPELTTHAWMSNTNVFCSGCVVCSGAGAELLLTCILVEQYGDCRVGQAVSGRCIVACCGFLVPAGARLAFDCVLFSGTRWVVRSRPNTMSWQDANVSCTCSSILIGHHAPMRLVARRGSANKTLPTEVMAYSQLTGIYF